MTIKEKLLVVRSGLGSSRRKTLLAGGVALALATAGLRKPACVAASRALVPAATIALLS